MIITDFLTKLRFEDIPATMPSTWYLGDFIPGGVLDISQLQVRMRQAGRFWTGWNQVDSWDPVTKYAGFFRSGQALFVEFRRKTPRDAPYLDPLAPTSRVSQRNLQVNADQGVFAATEWAAEYGIDAKQLLLSEPGVGPNSLGLVQLTQNHWAPSEFFTIEKHKVWNFQFAGGYMDRSHVKVQVKLAAGWQNLTVDPSENNPLAPSSAPFRFLGDYQLYLDLTTLGEPVQGLIIYRHTPRNTNVSSPPDAAIITGYNMEPSARHAFFVTVEIGEEISRRAEVCECGTTFTSEPYPIVMEVEGLRPGVENRPEGSRLLSSPNWTDKMAPSVSIMSGQLRVVLQSYSNGLDKMSVGSIVQSGTFVTTVDQYANGLDKLGVTSVIQSGTLVVTLVPYLNAIPEKIEVGALILGGTLA